MLVILDLAVGTISGLRAELKRATETLIQARTSTVSVSSGCELFLRFITMTSLEETVRWGEAEGEEGGEGRGEREEEVCGEEGGKKRRRKERRKVMC